MNFAKLDELYDDNRKIKRAWRRDRGAVGLHAQAITYCKRHQTDGIVDIDWLEEKLPDDEERATTVAALVDGGLFEAVDDAHWMVHDFLDYQTSSADRRKQSMQAAAAANARWHPESMRTASEQDAPSIGDRNAE
jgi:hypothetical protein